MTAPEDRDFQLVANTLDPFVRGKPSFVERCEIRRILVQALAAAREEGWGKQSSLTEPSDRDHAEAIASSDEWIEWADIDKSDGSIITGLRRGKLSRMIRDALAVAREEGRCEERQRCARIADDQAAIGDEYSDPAVVSACRITAKRIWAGEEPPK